MSQTKYTTCTCGHRWGRHCGPNRCGEAECKCAKFRAITRVCAVCNAPPCCEIMVRESDITIISLDIGAWHLPVIDHCVTLCVEHNCELMLKLEHDAMYAIPETMNPIQIGLTHWVSWKS